MAQPTPASTSLRPMPQLIFGSRWLQLPLYLGLIVAQCVYVFLFLKELWHLVSHATTFSEQQIMLIVLGLIDVVMISNLLVMVIVGGYETFVSRLRPEGPSRPAGMAEPRQRQRAQDQAGDGDHRHLVDPPAADLHRGRQSRLAGRRLHRGRHHVADASSTSSSSCRRSASPTSTGSARAPLHIRPRRTSPRSSCRRRAGHIDAAIGREAGCVR